MDTLTPAEVAQLLGTSPNRVRQLLRDRKLMAVPGSGNGKIPADFVQDGVILKHLPGPADRAPGRRVQRRGGLRLAVPGGRLAARHARCRRCATTGTPRSPAGPRPWRSSRLGDGAPDLPRRCSSGAWSSPRRWSWCCGVRVYARWRRLLLAVLPEFVVFVAWVLYAIAQGHWDYSAERTLGVRLPGGIPVEEVLFFLVVPLCAVLALRGGAEGDRLGRRLSGRGGGR